MRVNLFAIRNWALLQCNNVIPNLTKIFDGVNSVPLVHKCGR